MALCLAALTHQWQPPSTWLLSPTGGNLPHMAPFTQQWQPPHLAALPHQWQPPHLTGPTDLWLL